MHPTDNAAVADRYKYCVGCDKRSLGLAVDFAQLQSDFIRDGLLAFGHVRVVAGAAVVPAKLKAGLHAQVKGVVVSSIDSKNGAAVDEQLSDFGWGRRFWHKDDRGLACGSGESGQGGGSVAGAGRSDYGPAFLACARHGDGRGAILKRGAGVAPVIFDVEFRQAKRCTQPRRGEKGRVADGQRRQAGAAPDGQEIGKASD